MPANLGSPDRIVRVVLGIALVAVAFVPGMMLSVNPLTQWGAVLIGVVLIATAVMRFCPLYRLFGLSTCKVSRR